MSGPVLAIDTALAQCAVCVLTGGRANVIAEPMTKGHAERLPLMVREGLSEAGVAARDLERVVATTGPGSFTGVRVGLAFARGLGVGTETAVLGLSSLEALAISAGAAAEGEAVAAVIDAKRGEVFLQMFDGETGAALAPPAAVATDAAPGSILREADGRAVRLVGSGTALVAGALREAGAPFVESGVEAIDVRALAEAARGRTPEPGGPRALYVRAPDATPPAPSPFAARG
ncbi:MAG: tRNA (adenosine(37)-N6)-threonylcarbamoyltransferase complex dimerization subunit type 1 TsaB [Pseudomonadota bacterium]